MCNKRVIQFLLSRDLYFISVSQNILQIAV